MANHSVAIGTRLFRVLAQMICIRAVRFLCLNFNLFVIVICIMFLLPVVFNKTKSYEGISRSEKRRRLSAMGFNDSKVCWSGKFAILAVATASDHTQYAESSVGEHFCTSGCSMAG